MSLKDSAKSIARRALRPGLQDVAHTLDRIEAHLTGLPTASSDDAVGDDSPKQILKRAAYRATRPGVIESVERLAKVEQAVAARANIGVWRGTLRGHAVGPDGVANVALSQKYGPELAFWEGMVNRESQRLWGMPFFEKCRQWQRGRIAELARWLDLASKHGAGWSGIEAWSSTRTAVEFGPGPMPSIAMTKWRRSIAVDPIADGYASEGLLPPECEDVVYLASQGEHVPLPSAVADVVVIENALDHVSDPGATMAEIRRLLKHDGVVWLLVDLMDYSDEMHPHPFNESRLRTLFRSVGLAPMRERIKKDGGCHPEAYGEYRALLAKIGSPRFSTDKKSQPADHSQAESKPAKPGGSDNADIAVTASSNGVHAPAN